MSGRYRQVWISWAGPLFLVIYVFVGIWLAYLRHAAFNTALLDLGYYTHVLWNTAHGFPFANNIPQLPPYQFMDHFDPALVLLAPLFWFFPDARTLQAVTVVALALTMVPHYLLVREHHPVLAPLVVLAFTLNPLGHQVASLDFHEIILVMPVLSFALYAIYRRRNLLIIGCLVVALLIREDVGLFVALIGLFMLFFREGQRRIGLAAVIVGVAWSLFLIVWVLPSFTNLAGLAGTSGDHAGTFRQLVASMIDDPLSTLSLLVAPTTRELFLRILLPVATLPVLATGEQLLWLPALLGTMFSGDPDIRLLMQWHVAPFLPLLWVSASSVLRRLPYRWATIAVIALLVTSVVGYHLWSWYPGGAYFDNSEYRITAHDLTGQTVLAQVPAGSAVVAQSKLAVHLAARKYIALFPWFSQQWSPDLIVLDQTDPNPYPLSQSQLQQFVLEYLARPDYRIVWEQDGYIIFEPGAALPPNAAQSLNWSNTLRLDSYDFAETNDTKAYVTITINQDRIMAGHSLRVELYWKSLAVMKDNYSISVRLVSPDGEIVAQDDAWPAKGLLSTLQWPVGQAIRDVHYLQIPIQNLPESMMLQVAIYNSVTKQRMAPESGVVLGQFAGG